MNEGRVERRLAAILAADVAGYSRLIGEDEEGTLAALRAMRRETIDAAIAEHRGRIVKTTGDGLLAEFQSVIDALRCATVWQAAVPTDSPIAWRIGVHQGDIVVEDGDIFGDGVNVAARLETLAEPGGICVSARVQEDSIGRLDLAFRDLGPQQLKNIGRPVHAYAIDLAATSRPALAIATVPRRSIVVLPFTNLTDDREQKYFADAITEDLTTDLSRLAGMLVISRNTAFAFHARRIDTRQVGRELGVRYVLEGSVRRVGNQVRINAHLTDAERDAHLWAERFDGDAGDLFALQDDVVRRIAIALNVEIADAEASRLVYDLDAVDCVLRGRAELAKPPSQENRDRAIEWFERALSLDAGFAEAQARLASTLAANVIDVLPGSSDSDLDRAEGLARQAVTNSPRSPQTRFAMGQVFRAQRRYAEAISEYESALALDRNFVNASTQIGRCKIYTGPVDDAIPFHEQAIRLSPRDPALWNWYFRIGEAHLLGCRLDEAIEWLEKARNAGPTVWYVHFYLAAAHTLKGSSAPAYAELREAKTLQGVAFDQAVTRLHGLFAPDPTIRARFETIIRAGLSAANSTTL